MSVFKGPGLDKQSSKRWLAAFCFTVAAVKTFVNPDFAMVTAWIAAGTALLGIGAATKS